MLRLHVAAPIGLVFKFSAAFLEKPDGFRIGNTGKIARDYIMQAFEKCVIDEFIKKFQLVGTGIEDVGNDVFRHRLGEVHIIREVGKSDLRLDHPKFGGMALGVGTLGAESRSERINLRKRLCEAFAVELSGNGEIRSLAKEILCEIHLAILCLR